MAPKSKTLPKYLHEHTIKNLEDNFVIQTEEYIVDGEKGIKIKYFHIDKSGRKKIVILSNRDGTFIMKTDIKGKTSEKTLSKQELIKEIKDDKDLAFVNDFIKTIRGGEWLNARSKGRKKSSKKSSKKHSKKTSKKRSKKTSKK